MAQRRKIKLTIAYDGTDYHGWQVQPGLPTVQGTLCEAASSLIGRKVHVHGASRTDAGVHARGQVGLIETVTAIPTENFVRALNDRLPPDIAVLEAVEPARWNFDLLGDVTRKCYRYTIARDRVRPVHEIRTVWHLPGPLDIEAMRAASRWVVGRRDFRSLASAADRRTSSVRTVFACDILEEASRIFIDVVGDGFLYNMVRNLVGTLVDIGHRRWPPEAMRTILEARDRTAAGQLAPPQGLCLQWIRYRDDEPADPTGPNREIPPP